VAEMTARMRRIASDWEQVRKDFAGHKNIVVTPVGELPPEKYHITYFVNGVYLLTDGTVRILDRHEVDIVLHAEYPRYKPICKISTPICHPNFRDGQICIGDIWGAGESLSDIIINIGDMIQYKSWNSYSPLSAEAAQWAIENRHLFPVGTVDLHIADSSAAKETVDIDLPDDEPEAHVDESNVEAVASQATSSHAIAPVQPGNDFDITAEDLIGIEFVPTAQRMQTMSHIETVKGHKINFKTVLVKGLMWALIGTVLGFGVSEIVNVDDASVARLTGHSELAAYYNYVDKADELYENVDARFRAYCKKNDLNPNDTDNLSAWMYQLSAEEEDIVDEFLAASDDADDALYSAYLDFDGDEDEFFNVILGIGRTGTAIWSAMIAMFIGLFLGIGESVYYGSKEKIAKYAFTGIGISIVAGYISGYFAQMMYAEMLSDSASDFSAAFIRGLGWALMGLGIGLAVGLIKPEKKRIFFCSIGGVTGAFVGGFLFNYITAIIPNVVVARGFAIIIMGALIGVGVGLLEQFAKRAWLKVVRGEFEGKEYLVFAGTTSIGNNGKNTIVLFKDKLVAPHHCDIVLEGNRYVLYDQGSQLGTVVNGVKITKHNLRQNDSIAIGNSVLKFNMKK